MLKTNPTKSKAIKYKYAKGTLLKDKASNVLCYIEDHEHGNRTGENIYHICKVYDNNPFSTTYENDMLLEFDIHLNINKLWRELNE